MDHPCDLFVLLGHQLFMSFISFDSHTKGEVPCHRCPRLREAAGKSCASLAVIPAACRLAGGSAARRRCLLGCKGVRCRLLLTKLVAGPRPLPISRDFQSCGRHRFPRGFVQVPRAAQCGRARGAEGGRADLSVVTTRA